MKKLDHRFSRAIHGFRLGMFDYLLAVPAMAFGIWGMPFTVGLIWLIFSWKAAIVAGAAALTTLAVTEPLKHVFRRERPEEPVRQRRFNLRALESNPSFPSGDSAHAGMVVALLLATGLVGGWVVYPVAVLLPLCMFSRVYYGAHWIGDTIAGAVLGVGVGLAYAGLFGSFING